MSMEIDWEKPLTPAARQYLADRDQHDRIRQMDEKFPPAETDDTSVVGPNDDWNGASGLEAVPTSELLAELDRREAAGEDVWGSADTSDAEDDTTPDDDYESRTVADLQSELRDRNLSDSGKKADLIARLRENDQVRAL